MSFGSLIALNVVVMAVIMAVLWKIHFRIHNAGIVDVGWSGGLALLGVLDAALSSGFGPRRALIGGMALIWGARLGLHLYFDRIAGKTEEPRYAALRAEWHDVNGVKFFFLFQFQGLLAGVLALPFILVSLNPTRAWSCLESAGIGLWLAALAGESLADAQLKTFKARPENKGKTCRQGLWRYSRHPNYFFEWLIWVAFFLFALPSPHGWVALMGPVLMLYFLLRVTGIPATEAQALKTRGEDYRDYQCTTSMFVPWFKRNRP